MTSTLATARRAWTLGTLAAAAGGRLVAARAETAIGGLSIDTRTLERGDLFVALAGPRFDGHDFLSAAVSRGAPAAMVQRDVACATSAGSSWSTSSTWRSARADAR